jgi:hypothetical protein
MKRTPVEKCMLKAALGRLGNVLKHNPGSMVNEQFGIAFAANELQFEGLLGTSVLLELDHIRTVAAKTAREVSYGY